MGDCGCALDLRRCNDHKDDVVVVLTPEMAEFARMAVADAQVHSMQQRYNKKALLSYIQLGGEREQDWTVPEVMRWLAEDPQRVADFFNRLGAGMWDEWDCGTERALEIFGEQEFAIALKSGASIVYANQEDQ